MITNKSNGRRQAGFNISGLRQQWSYRVNALRSQTHFVRPLGKRQAGFTIVELMIATLVFSTILLVITYGVLSFTHAYYRGVNSSTTQNTARSVIDTVSQSIQFSGSAIIPSTASGGYNYFCTNGQMYVYKLGVQYTGNTSTGTPGLYQKSVPNCTITDFTASGGFNGGKQLLGNHMRLIALSVSPANLNGSYVVSMRLAYTSGGIPEGDDLLCSPSISSGPGSCIEGSANLTDFTLPDTTCKLQTGSQFCAISALTTTVIKRVDNSQ